MNPTTTSTSTSPSLVAALHPDILLTHILSRLDGPTLASAASSSSLLHSLSDDDDHGLWKSISASTWPSVSHPLTSRVISTFPSGHRSFFSDAYPLLDHSPNTNTPSSSSLRTSCKSTSSLISAVDISYMGKLIVSRVQEMETVSGWFMSSPFRVDLLGQNESVPTPICTASPEKTGDGLDGWLTHLKQNLTLSWILIDPMTKRAASVTSRRPVSVQRHWLTGEVQARYTAVIPGGGAEGTEREVVCIVAAVTCWPSEGKEGAPVEVREVSLQVEDMEGKVVMGEGGLGAITGAMSEGRKRSKGEEGEEVKRRYEEYEVMKRKWREGKQRRERLLDLACMSIGVTLFIAFCSFLLFFR
ncbi:hypothetical protein MLD38_008224 [Melastoma candidum]|uniref:Uncharacterized protein n=1 Tax=Melastoma candidum TaxID=119954 RepID=A0ACB9RWP4_9MYRT|nr:hypothetical protein MLD38_008224 [Melastoma candidum]